MDAKTEKYGYVNKNGKVIVKAVYNEASEFSNGFAQVRKMVNQVLLIQRENWQFH